ncbi:MAG: lysylphosphatidylglycerol synthase transmembrane domain-containing protein [Longimicrobiales bacterium]
MSAVARRRGGLDWKGIFGIGISVVALYFVLRDVPAGDVVREIRRAHPGWLLACAAACTGTIACRAFRWRPLLAPMLPHPTLHARTAATFIGFMANNLLPARVGEFARAYALAKLQPVTISGSFASLVVERLFDAVSVIVLLLAAMAMPGFPSIASGETDFASLALLGLGVVLVALGLLIGLVLAPGRVIGSVERVAGRVLPKPFRRPIVDALHAFVDGLGVLRRPRLLVEAALGSVVVWGVSAASFWFGFLAFDIDAPFAAAMFLQSIIALAVAVPSAPGFFGLFEAAARVGLVNVFGVEIGKAVGFAIGVHIVGFVPVTVIGLYYLWRLGLSWREVEISEHVVEEDVELRHPGTTA